jgi:hypothetical protein
MQEFEYIRAFVSQNSHPQRFIFKNDGTHSPKNKFGDTAAKISILREMRVLIHLFVRKAKHTTNECILN